ncbi:MAG: Helicase SKI2W, partial [Paramarteilia canceri]
VPEIEESYTIDEKVNKLNQLLSQNEEVQYLPEYGKRLSLLKTLGYVDKSVLVTIKGRIACEFCVHEILMTQMLFENTFKSMEIEAMCGLLSSLVHEGSRKIKINKSSPEQIVEQFADSIDSNLKESVLNMLYIAKKIDETEKQHLISHTITDSPETNDVSYLELFNFELCNVVYLWASGKSFSEIIKETDTQEGNVVRCIQRLEELLRNLKEASILIGALTIEKKVEEALNAIKRDIVFTASLYTE